MRVRPAHLVVAAITAVAALTSAGAAQASSTSAADQPIGRYAAYQACQAAMWKWTAQNAKDGTAVHAFRHHYRAQDVWRERGGWHVQVGGERGQAVTPNNDVEFCVVVGTNAKPKLIDYAYPR
jgi:hypothetical protein